MVPWLAAVLIAAPAGFIATDNDWSPRSVTVNPGASVTFAYPEGEDEHNAVFTATSVNCTQTAGGGVGPTGSTIPETAQTKGWAGECTFTREGTFKFFCVVHPEMEGQVVVGTPATDPTPTSTPTPAPGATATPVPIQGIPTVTPTPTPAPAKRKLTVAATQKGTKIKGTIAGVTGKVTIAAYRGSKRVGRTTRTGPGRFTVKVSKKGKLTLKVTAAGKTDTKKVTLR